MTKKLPKVRKVPLIFFILALINIITIITAPYTIPPGTVNGLDGKANYIDYAEKWFKLNPYAGTIYLIGDFNCHQKEERSYFLNSNQMPVCSRDVGMALGFLLGSLVLFATIPVADPFKMALTPVLRDKAHNLTKNKASLIVVIFGIILMLPLLYDGLLQTFTVYESDNFTRLITGILFGFALVIGLAVYLESYIYKYLFLKKIE